MKSNLFYSEIEKKLLSNIKNTKKSLKIAVAWFTNPSLFSLINNLIDNNVEIELILSDEKLNFINEKINFQELIDKNVKIRISKSPKLMHNKFCIIDNKILITGSYNWTLKAEKNNLENIIISTDEKLVDDFISYFDFLKNNLEIVTNISKIKLVEYIEKKEYEIELELLKQEKKIDVKVEKQEIKNDYDSTLNKLIDEAELLYLSGKLNESITFSEKQLIKHKNIPDFYFILALCFWRLKNYEKQIFYSQKTLEMDINPEFTLDCYNLLGIGYSHSKGGEQQSIFYYKKCIDQKPDEHSFRRNRAISYIYLENLANLPLKIRNSYKLKANEDLNKIVEIAKNFQNKDYQLLHSEAVAYDFLGNQKKALTSINQSIEAYNSESDIFKKDENEFKEMKFLQKMLKKEVK